MNSKGEFKETLKKHFNMHGARLKFLVNFIFALLITRNVNFTKIANIIDGSELESSRYKQIQRFFRLFVFDSTQIAKFVASVIPISHEKWMLSIDRTNWKFGKQNINILTLAIVYKGIAFPIMWLMLDKKGNSNTYERIKLIEQFIILFGEDKVDSILADREFIGKDWFEYLLNNINVNFRIRIKGCEYINKKNGDSAHVKNFFRTIRIGEHKILEGKRVLWNHWIYITGTKSSNGEYVIVVTNNEPKTALENYARRWEIESLFKCLKSSGFNFEDTHLADLDRISTLMSVLTIAFCWAYLTGEFINEKKPIKKKTHGRYEVSIFRLGLNTLGEIIFRIDRKVKEFMEVIKLLSCT